VLPTYFNWPLFLAALGLMAAPIILELPALRRRCETTIEGVRAT
jgi:hypothetical protein